MDAVIPRPAARTVGDQEPGTAGGAVAARGPWRVRAADAALDPVAEVVGALLAPHLPGGPHRDGGLHRDGAEGPDVLDLVLALDCDDEPAPSSGHRERVNGALPRTGEWQTIGVAPDGSPHPVDETYRLTVAPDGITCRARTPEGVFRAATTAAQLIITAPEGARLPFQDLTDAPRYAWRGLMLDPARTFLSPDELRRIIDLAALYKLNVLHLHLTDNEGWRLELPRTPQFTGPQPDGTVREFYSAAEFRALQEYAAARFVTVVPEIDLPGHCTALRDALPGLRAAPAPEGLEGRVAFTPPLDLTDPQTRTVLTRVFTDVCELTAGPYVHIGADEALGATPESFVASVRELRALVRECGKRPLGWQESARAGLGTDDIVQHWVNVPMMDLPDTAEEFARRPELAGAGLSLEFIKALKSFFAPTDHDLERALAGGGRVLLSPQSHLYLDRPYAAEVAPPEQAAAAARLGFPSYRPLGVRDTALWDPASYGIPDEQVAGVEATVFAERFKGFEDVTMLLLPRLAAVAEAAWCGRAPRWPEYRDRLARHGRMWDERGLAYFATTEVSWA